MKFIRVSSRRIVPALIIALCGVGAAVFSASTPAQQNAPLTKVSIATVPGTFPHFILRIASDRGYFKKNGLEPEFTTVSTGPGLVTALVSGDTQFSHAALLLMWPAMQKGENLLVLRGANLLNYIIVSCGTVPPPNRDKPFPQNLSDLAGHTLGTNGPGTLLDRFARRVLHKAGILDKVTIVAAGGPATHITACKEHKIDFLATPPPFDSRLGKKGVDYFVLYDSLNPATSQHLFDDMTSDAFVVSGIAKAKNPKLPAQFCAAIKEANAWAQNDQNIDDVSRMLAANMNIDVQTARSVWETQKKGMLPPITEAIWKKHASIVFGRDAEVPNYKKFTSPECGLD